jgi:hypothetical protein
MSSVQSYQIPQSPQETPPAAVSAPYPWILHPVIDMLFVCGGFFWLLVGLFFATGAKVDLYGSPAAFSLAAISVVGIQLLGDTHTPATLFRVYGSKTTRESLGKIVALIGILALAVGLCTYFVASTTTFFLKIVLAWGLQHQLAQSYGIALVYCYKRGYFMSRGERNVMFGMIQATIVYMVLRMFAFKEFAAFKLNGYNVPFWQIVPEWLCSLSLLVLQASVLLFAAMVLRKYIREKRIFPLPALCTLMTLVILALCTKGAFLVLWYLFSTWWFHSCQYLAVTAAFYFKEKGLPENVPLSQISRMLLTPAFAKYFAVLFVPGFLVFYYLPNWMADHGAEKAIAIAAIYVAFNLHHYITDALIWKLRDPQIQKLLIA